MYKHLPCVILISFAIFASADTEIQTDWSGGPGDDGPVFQWLNSFSAGSGVDISNPGFVEMGTGIVSFDETIISPDFGLFGIVSPGDFDGDGDIDVICDDMDQWKFVLFENLDGAGTQWEQHDLFDMPWIPNKDAEVVDLDMDGDLDLLTATGPYFTFWENTGTEYSSWEQHTISDRYEDAYSISSVDIDNDGDLDVIGADNQVSHIISLWENLDGTGHTWEEHVVDQSETSWPGCICLADVDNDNDWDFFYYDRNTGQHPTGWYEYLGSWTWEKHIVCTNPEAQSMSAADYNNDGNIDFAVAIGGTCRIWENVDGTGENWEFHNYSGVAGYFILSLQSVDIDSDGDIDIVGSGCKNYVDDILLIFENPGGFGNTWIMHALKTEYERVSFRGISDINSDGDPDIVGTVSGPEILWYDVAGPAHTGFVQSLILDTEQYPDWESISWTSNEPTGTDVFFLLRSSNDPETMGAWCDTIFEPGSLAGYIDSTHRYIQYLACMTTDSDEYGPVLDEVSLLWTTNGIEDKNMDQSLTISVSPNPSCNEVFITVPAWASDVASVSVYDISGKLVKEVTDRVSDVFHWNLTNSSGLVVSAGTYFVRCVSEDMSSTVRLIRL